MRKSVNEQPKKNIMRISRVSYKSKGNSADKTHQKRKSQVKESNLVQPSMKALNLKASVQLKNVRTPLKIRNRASSHLAINDQSSPPAKEETKEELSPMQKMISSSIEVKLKCLEQVNEILLQQSEKNKQYVVVKKSLLQSLSMALTTDDQTEKNSNQMASLSSIVKIHFPKERDSDEIIDNLNSDREDVETQTSPSYSFQIYNYIDESFLPNEMEEKSKQLIALRANVFNLEEKLMQVTLKDKIMECKIRQRTKVFEQITKQQRQARQSMMEAKAIKQQMQTKVIDLKFQLQQLQAIKQEHKQLLSKQDNTILKSAAEWHRKIKKELFQFSEIRNCNVDDDLDKPQRLVYIQEDLHQELKKFDKDPHKRTPEQTIAMEKIKKYLEIFSFMFDHFMQKIISKNTLIRKVIGKVNQFRNSDITKEEYLINLTENMNFISSQFRMYFKQRESKQKPLKLEQNKLCTEENKEPSEEYLKMKKWYQLMDQSYRLSRIFDSTN